ncbi:MAG: hypothetical protein QOG59_3539 [Solirubrobacteraceae bacterium]|nr:hypothetical protein [Solirubrobacteraceae bacterium]
MHEAALELEGAIELRRRAPASPAVIDRCAQAVVLALRALLADRGSVLWADAEPAALPALLGEAGLRPPSEAMRLIDPEAVDIDSDEALNSAHAALAWSSGSLTAA